MNFHTNPASRNWVAPREQTRVDKRTDGRTEMKKLIVAFRSFANAPKKRISRQDEISQKVRCSLQWAGKVQFLYGGKLNAKTRFRWTACVTKLSQRPECDTDSLPPPTAVDRDKFSVYWLWTTDVAKILSNECGKGRLQERKEFCYWERQMCKEILSICVKGKIRKVWPWHVIKYFFPFIRIYQTKKK